jgi:hemerythrin-like domain-containing protein
VPVSPTEDLMREHGALARVLLIYEDSIRRLRQGYDSRPHELSEAVGVVRRFIQGYHERLEEEHIFPRFAKGGPLAGLVAELQRQHEAGRHLTERIGRRMAAPTPRGNQRLAADLLLFIRMYRPHKAREDTVLFPALHTTLGPSEFAAMGEMFESREHEVLGAEGYEGVIATIERLEKSLGLYDLARFRPNV